MGSINNLCKCAKPTAFQNYIGRYLFKAYYSIAIVPVGLMVKVRVIHCFITLWRVDYSITTKCDIFITRADDDRI